MPATRTRRSTAESRASYGLGEGLVGQAAADRQRLLLTDIPPDTINVRGGLLSARPRNVIVLPVLYEGHVKAVVELASLYEFTPSHLAFLEQLTGSIGVVLNTIEATMRTEGLLKQSQQLAGELQAQQTELQQTNEELANKAKLLAEQNAEVERKNQEIELARRALEEKAAELALTSRYKSEFLANMSHELRTPLNSILILGQQLSENADKNLSARQVEFAKTIHGAGTDLLNLISDILDLSKIESGTVTVECEDLLFTHLRETIERNFRHEADARKLSFTADFDPRLRRAHYHGLQAFVAGVEEPAVERFEVHGPRRRAVACRHGYRRLESGPPDSESGARPWWSSRSAIPVSVSRPRSRRSSSRRSNRRTPGRRASTVAPVSDWRSAASSRICSAARFA